MKNDVRKRLLLGWAAILCVNCAFMACSDDDDESNSLSSSARPGTIKVGDTNYRIESIGDIDFEYSENGELVKIDDYVVSNKPFKIVELDGEDDEMIISNFSFNGSGYITKYTVTERWFYSENDKGEGKSNISVSYNKTGQITKLVESYNSVEYYEGDKFVEKGTETFTYTYKDGNLIQVTDIGADSDETWSCICEYEYDDIDNIYGQFTYGLTYCFNDFFLGEELASLGLLGVPSKKLPVRLSYSDKGSYKDEDGDNHEYEDKDSYNISYSYNNVDLISQERFGSSNIRYYYWGDTDASYISGPREPMTLPVRRQHGLLRKMNRRQ